MGKLFNRRKKHLSADELKNEGETDENIEKTNKKSGQPDEDIYEIKEDKEDPGSVGDEDDNGSDKNESDEGSETDKIDDIDENDKIDEEKDEEVEPAENVRRTNRRKRRIRNQIAAYGVVVIFAAILVMAGITLQRRVSDFLKERQSEEQLQTDLADVQKEELEQEEIPGEVVIEAPPEIEEEVEEDTMDEQLEEFINTCILAMPLEDKVAGLFVVTPEALTGVRTVVQAGEGTQNALSRYAIGGLIYFPQNILNEDQLKGMLSNTISMSKYPIFLSVDEEGGSVSRIAGSNISVANVGDMAVIGASGNAAMAYDAGVTIGSYLSDIGFNLDFAPVADIADAENEILGNRSFGSDADVTADMVSNVVKGIEGNGVSACLKHFPGLGSADEDTHDGRVEITKSLEEMRNSDFIPFQAGIEAGVNLIMVGHVTASGIDTEGLPSSLSRVVITDVLRGELGYDGIVITDALNMGAISEYYTSDEAAVRAIRAGADMLLMPEDFETAYKGVLAAVQNGTILEERIDESLRRIYRIKYADKL